MKTIEIAINGLSITNRSGTARVVEGLLDGLSRIEVSDLRFHIILPQEMKIKPDWEETAHLEFHSIGPTGTAKRVFWEQGILPRWIRHHNIELLHCPAFIAPRIGLGQTRSVVTIHDLAFLRFPKTVRWERRFYYRWAVLSSIKNADLILTDSEAVRWELRSKGIPDARLNILPLGVDDRFFLAPEDEIARVRQKFNLPERYFLTVGTLEPRKNLETLLAAHERTPAAPPLMIAGRLGWGYKSILKYFHNDRLYFLSYVSDMDLPGLYAGAELFLAPSLYEGFGLTVLEAMAAGCMVVASDIPAYREIGGRCIRYIPADNIEKWVEAMRGASQDDKRSLRVGRAREFSWVRHAERYVLLLEKVCA